FEEKPEGARQETPVPRRARRIRRQHQFRYRRRYSESGRCRDDHQPGASTGIRQFAGNHPRWKWIGETTEPARRTRLSRNQIVQQAELQPVLMVSGKPIARRTERLAIPGRCALSLSL